MKGLSARLLLAFTVASVVPAGVVGLWSWRAEDMTRRMESARETELADAARSARREEDAAVVTQLCRDDLLIDRWMSALAEGDTETPRRLERQIPTRRRAMRFDHLAIIDLRSGEGRGMILGSDGALGHAGELALYLADAIDGDGDEPLVVGGGDETDGGRQFLVHCVTERDHVRLGVIAGHDIHEPPEDDSDLATMPRQAWQRRLGGALFLALGLAIFLALLVSRRLSRPLLEIESAARRVASGDLQTAVDDTSPGAARSTMTAFNEMTEELGRAQRRLRRAERIAAWRDIARRIAHEIKNPLSPIQVSIETLRKTYAKKHPDFDEIFEESTLTILEEVDRMKRIVTEFSDFARLPRPKPAPTSLAEVAEHVVSLHRGDDVAITLEIDDALDDVQADREQVTQVILNLVQNGCDAARARHGAHGGRLEVSLTKTSEGCAIRVADNGPGIPEDQRLAIFEPYYTTKSEGTGLGLAITLRIVEDHGGSLEVDDGIEGGAAMRLWLPRSGPPRLPETTLTESPFLRRR